MTLESQLWEINSHPKEIKSKNFILSKVSIVRYKVTTTENKDAVVRNSPNVRSHGAISSHILRYKVTVHQSSEIKLKFKDVNLQ